MKVYVVYGFWRFDNGAVILKAFNNKNKAEDYIANFDYEQRMPIEGYDDYWDEFDYLEYDEKEVE